LSVVPITLFRDGLRRTRAAYHYAISWVNG